MRSWRKVLKHKHIAESAGFLSLMPDTCCDGPGRFVGDDRYSLARSEAETHVNGIVCPLRQFIIHDSLALANVHEAPDVVTRFPGAGSNNPTRVSSII